MGKESAAPGQFSGAPWQHGGSGGGLDFGQAAAAQGREGHVNQSNPFASSSWNQGPDGSWSQSTSFNGDLGKYAQGLEGQLGAQGPLDFSSLPKLGTGEDARNAAESNLYSRATSRLDPQWDAREATQRTQLLNQGLDPSSAAYTKAMDDFGRQRNDAYSTARNDSITGGGAEASRQFGMDLTGRQQMLSEMLRSRTEPLQELGALQGFGQGFQGVGAAGATPWLQAVQGMGNYSLGQTQQSNQNSSDFWGGLLSAAGKIGATTMSAGTTAALCDERSKTNIERLDVEAPDFPGVPMATFEYLHEPGVKYAGVIAQDVERLHPEKVLNDHPDGFKRVVGGHPFKLGK